MSKPNNKQTGSITIEATIEWKTDIHSIFVDTDADTTVQVRCVYER